MIESKSQSVKAIRIEVAINICLRFPSLYNKMMDSRGLITSKEEYVMAQILGKLLRLEPCIKYILDFYYKRELR